MPQIDDPDLEAIRTIAAELSAQWHFHEIAMSRPFEAEEYVLNAGRRLQQLVGWPAGTMRYLETETDQ